MNYSLEFPYRYSYESHTPITLPIVLLSDLSRSVDVVAAVDTGSTLSIFERSYGEALGLNVESGSRERIATATGYFYCYGHELTVSVFDLEWQAIVYFAESEVFWKNVLGRVGFLDRLRVGIVDYEHLLYLSDSMMSHDSRRSAIDHFSQSVILAARRGPSGAGRLPNSGIYERHSLRCL